MLINLKKIEKLFIFKTIIEKLEIGIKERRKTKIHFKDNREVTVLPFFIGSSKLELANYLFCYDFLEEDYKNYHIHNKYNFYYQRDKKNGKIWSL